MVMEDDDAMKQHLKYVKQELEKAEDDVQELEMIIGDTSETWDRA
jgi:hypothetical protein